MGLGKTLREVEQMDAIEFAWWRAFYEVDPWGHQRLDLNAAMLMQVIAGLFSKPPELEKLMPFLDGRRDKKPESAESIMAKWKLAASMAPKIRAGA